MHTFKEAADSYVLCGGEGRFLPRILAAVGERDVTTISPMEARALALTLYPDASNGTRNRQALTPIRSVLYHAHELGWRIPARIRPFLAPKIRQVVPANRRWMETFVDQCDNDGLHHVAALVLFMNLTGARVSEAIRLVGQDVDLIRKTALLRKTKTDTNSVRFMPDHLVERIRDLNVTPEARVFRYTSRYSVNERIKAVCLRAGIPNKSSHVVGRHSFATNALNMGVGVRQAMDAGGWKSSVVFLETYAHTRDSGRLVMDRFNEAHRQDQL